MPRWASSWDRDLIREVGVALGEEARALEVDVLLGPAINIKRSPLGGRVFEYLSEDPRLTGELAAAYVQGVQSTGVGTSLKHFAVNSQETDRMRVDAQVDARALREIYLPAFEKVVKDAAPTSVMSAYNAINGTFASENHWLLTELLRDEWGYDGLVVSDWGAIKDRVEALKAGLDLEMPGTGDEGTAAIIDAVRYGRIDPHSSSAARRDSPRSPSGPPSPQTRRGRSMRTPTTPSRGVRLRHPSSSSATNTTRSRSGAGRRSPCSGNSPSTRSTKAGAARTSTRRGWTSPSTSFAAALGEENVSYAPGYSKKRPGDAELLRSAPAPRPQRPTSRSCSSDCMKRTSPKGSTGSTSTSHQRTSR